MTNKLLAFAVAAVAPASIIAYGATTVPAVTPASASISRPPACAPPTSPTPPPLKPTTITTIEQAYYCIFNHYYSGPILSDRALLVPAFAAFTQELQRRGLDQADATLPALTGNRDRDMAAFAAVYRQVTAGLRATPALRQELAAATLSGMVASLHDDHAVWNRGPIFSTELGILINDVQGPDRADPTATPPLFVTSLLPGSPATAKGVKPGDEIISVNGIPPFINGTLSQGVLDWINNPQGPVRLTLHRPSTGRTFTVTVAQPRGPAPGGGTGSGGTSAPGGGLQVTSRLLRGDIAYVQMPGFFPGSAGQVLAAIARLRKTATLRGVILDLRGNTGGDAAEVARLLGALVHNKAFNYFCDIRGHCTPMYTDDSVPLLHLPLIALMDRNCASACEGFVSSVKDLHLGILVGARTAGAASGTAAGYLLDDNSELGLPSEHALMAGKEIIDTIGVAPGYNAPLTADALSNGHDAGIDKALSLLP